MSRNLTADTAATLVGKTVTVHAREYNSVHKTQPKPYTGRVIAVGKVLGGYQSAPWCLVLGTETEGVPIISLARITRIETGNRVVFDRPGRTR